jgi:hypothetical protein
MKKERTLPIASKIKITAEEIAPLSITLKKLDQFKFL